MKRHLALLVIATLALSLTGCSLFQTSKDNQDQPTVLKLALREGTYSQVVGMNIRDFEDQNNVRCELLELSEEELYNTILNSSDSASKVDLCMVSGSWMSEFTSKELLCDLSEYGYSLDEDIIKETTDICYYNGDVYCAPYFGNVSVLMYNKKMVEDAGYTTEDISSLEDVFKICESAQDAGYFGFLYRGDTNNDVVVDFLPILLSYGGWVVDENNQPTVNSVEFKEAMEFYKRLTATGKATTKDDIVNALSASHGAMTIGWPGWYVPTEDGPVDYMALSGRAAEGAEVFNANLYGIWALGVSSYSNHKEETMELLNYLMDPELQKKSVFSGGVPCRYSALSNEEILAEYPQYRNVLEALESGVYRPSLPNWNEFMDILAPYMTSILDGSLSTEDGLNQAQAELETLMGL